MQKMKRKYILSTIRKPPIASHQIDFCIRILISLPSYCCDTKTAQTNILFLNLDQNRFSIMCEVYAIKIKF